MNKLQLLALVFLALSGPVVAKSEPDRQWEALAERYLDEMPAFSPVGATGIGDHRFDGELGEIGPETRSRWVAFLNGVQRELAAIDRAKLTRAHQVDYALLAHSVESSRWSVEDLQAWAWNPTIGAGAKSEDTVLVTPMGHEIMTCTPLWPTIAVAVGGETIERNGILTAG